VLHLDHVSKSFRNKRVINDLSLSIGTGVHGLLAPNGAGKTTLIQMIATLIRPDSGNITWNGQDIMMQSIAISAWERKRQNQRLNQIGVAWRSIAWSGVMETLTDVAGGAVMALLGIAIVEGCIALSFVQAGMSMALTPVPVGRFLLVTVVLLLVAVFTSWVCSLRSRKAEEG